MQFSKSRIGNCKIQILISSSVIPNSFNIEIIYVNGDFVLKSEKCLPSYAPSLMYKSIPFKIVFTSLTDNDSNLFFIFVDIFIKESFCIQHSSDMKLYRYSRAISSIE